MPNGCEIEGEVKLSKDKLSEFKSHFNNINFDTLKASNGVDGTLIGGMPEIKGPDGRPSVRCSVEAWKEKDNGDGSVTIELTIHSAYSQTDFQAALMWFEAYVDDAMEGDMSFHEPGAQFAGKITQNGEAYIEYEDLPSSCDDCIDKADADEDFNMGDHECCTEAFDNAMIDMIEDLEI